MQTTAALIAERIPVEDSLEAFNTLAEELGWSDGLPLVPPTAERVEKMLAYCDRDPQESLGPLPPLRGEATYEKVAINAVMAGCRPEYFPVVCAAVAAVADPAFNLYGIQATTNPVAPLIIVNGPIARALGFNAGGNAFGQGWSANATVGRALRLALLNIGGGRPQTLDRATQGFPGKYTFCAAENEADSPWEPLHVERGLRPEDSAVTVLGTQGYHNIVDIVSKRGRDLLTVMAAGMAAWGTNNMTHGGEPALTLSPEHAKLANDDGFGKREAREFLFERARFDATKLPPDTREMLAPRRPAWVRMSDFPVCDRPEDILLMVVGGPGIHAAFLPSFGATRAVTRPLTRRDGTPIRRVEELRR
jgi:hypothetical protein